MMQKMSLQSFGTARNPAAVETILIAEVARYTLNALLDKDRRLQHKQQCAERLKSREGNQQQIHYAEQAILANLDWGIDALEEAIHTPNAGTKYARLEHAEKMLQVCALLDTNSTTAGVPNSYLSAWAHLNLSFVWKLRSDDRNAAKHILDMFLADPLYSRIDFASELWEHLFQPHLVGIMSWYSDQRSRLMLTLPPSYSQEIPYSETMDGSFSRDDFSYYSRDYETLLKNHALAKVTSDQAVQLQVLENLYQNSLDDHTRQYARYYKEWLTLSVDSPKRRMPPMMPIAEPPMTPIHDFSSPAEVSASKLNRLESIREEDRDNRNEAATKDFQSIESKHSSNSSPSMRSAKGVEMKEVIKQLSKESSPKRKTSRSSSLRRGNKNLTEMPKKDLQKSNSKRLFDLFKDHGVKISSPRASSSASSRSFDYLTKTSPSNNINELRLPPDAETSSLLCRTGHASSYKDDEIENNIDGSSPYTSSSTSAVMLEDDFEEVNRQGRSRHPKDFVCPITNQLFSDPVTLETGQTYERRAIQEWLDRGNTTCPITRQNLANSVLPKSNYVLKRLVSSWKEQHPEVALESPFYQSPLTTFPEVVHSGAGQVRSGSPDYLSSSSSNSSSSSSNGKRSIIPAPKNVSMQQIGTDNDNDLDYHLAQLKPALTSLCMSDDLEECEAAVLTISDIWDESEGDLKVESNLTKGGVIEGLIEVLSTSDSTKVQRAALYLLSELVVRDEFTRQAIMRCDPELECISRLVKRGVAETIVLLYQLNCPVSKLSILDLVPDLVDIIKCDVTPQKKMASTPKSAAVMLLEQLVNNGSSNFNAQAVMSLGLIHDLVENLEAKDLEERLGTMSILLRCMKADGKCRNLIAKTAHLGHVVELLLGGNNIARQLATLFFSELVHLNRRISNNQILKTVKKEGMLSSMHVLLVYLHHAPSDHRHVAANLLLQLELQDEPWTLSIYREEAIEAIVGALENKNSLHVQVAAAETVVALAGRFSFSGKPLTEAWLLKSAGMEQTYSLFMNEDNSQLPSHDRAPEDEEAASEWECKVARVLLAYDRGVILEVLGQNLQNKSPELLRPCMIAAVWLCRMIKILPDTGLRPTVRRCCMSSFLFYLASAKQSQQRALAALGLHTLIDDAASFQELVSYAKDIIKPLRQLKKATWVANDIIKAFIKEPSLNPTDVWQHGEIGQIDVGRSGEVKALARNRGRLFSGHSDGSIQVWDAKKKSPTLITILKEHTKAITSLAVSNSTSRLYSGSLDKTLRVWAIGPDDSMRCVYVMDVKEGVQAVTVSGSMLCISTQSHGIRVQSEEVPSKLLNTNKHIQSIAVSNGRIYCGCTDNSIQEVDVEQNSIVTIQPSTRTLLGKKPIYAIQVNKKEIFTAGSLVDGASVKVWSQADNSLLRSIATTQEVKSMAVNDDFIYVCSHSGSASFIEVWLRERSAKVMMLNVSSKVNALLLDGDVLYSGCEDGKIRVWGVV